MDHFIIYHVLAVGFLLVFLDCLEDNVNIIGLCMMRGRELAIDMQFHRRLDIPVDGGVFDLPLEDCLSSNEGDSKTSDEIISCLDIVLWEAGIVDETNTFSPT